MSEYITEKEIDSFMSVLRKIQSKINRKHGAMTIYNWRKRRHERKGNWDV